MGEAVVVQRRQDIGMPQCLLGGGDRCPRLGQRGRQSAAAAQYCKVANPIPEALLERLSAE